MFVFRRGGVPVCLLLSAVVGVGLAQAREFNWVPSGVINVGDRASEAAGRYESTGELEMVTLAYQGEAARPHSVRRLTGPEQFTIEPASYRGGPAPAPLVIARASDTADGAYTLRVNVNGQDVGSWKVSPPAGERRIYDALYVIPQSQFVGEGGNVPREVKVTLTPEGLTAPVSVFTYRFFAARDWDLLGDKLAGDVTASAAQATGAAAAYLAGVLAEADRSIDAARASFEKAAESDDAELARLARVALRRTALREARAAQRPAPGAKLTRADFETHYRLGLYAAGVECWEDAREEFALAVAADPMHADATYRLAEAMEFCRLPIDEWAPLMERAGFLYNRTDTNVQDVLIAVHTEAVKDMCGEFSLESLRQLQRDWRHVEQMTYGAARGAWQLRTHWRIYGPDSVPWVMQAGWIFLPPDSEVPVEGTYDYSIGTAEFGASHAGGVDCGVSGSGGANIGPTRGWEVWLHEWNHEFDWTAISSEQLPGYPCTHDSDGCGKQPIVNMGCGHRSSMRYYIPPAQYQRHQPADPVVPAAFVNAWAVGGLTPAPQATAGDADALAEWLVAQGHFTARRIEELKREWQRAVEEEQKRATTPPIVPPYPAPRPVGEWHDFLTLQWQRVKLLDQLAHADEAQLVNGTAAGFTAVTAGVGENFVDLRQALPNAPDKCVAYARTYIWSPESQEVRLWIGYNDTAAFWLNGRQIHRGEYYACAKWDDANRPYMLASSGRLEQGWNVLVAKVERGGGDWGFSVHAVGFDKQPVAGLKYAAALPAGERAARYAPPAAGPHYRWADVREDYLELLPRLTSADLAQITGITGLTVAEHEFMLTVPEGRAALPGSAYVAAPDKSDRALNNFLNWDTEAAAALRYERDGQVRDLVLVRPEYFDEYLTLLREPGGRLDGKPVDERVLGCIFLREARYDSAPSHRGRAVLVLDAALGDYPADALDLLTPVAAR
jgi:hypothetical protein